MTDKPTIQGKTTIAADVLITIAKLNALSVPGVSRLAQVSGGVDRLFQRGSNDGVRIDVEHNVVDIDLYVIIQGNTNVREVSRNIQAQVTRAISEMVGMDVGRVDIHVEDIDYTTSKVTS